MSRDSPLLCGSSGAAPGADCVASDAYALFNLPVTCTIRSCGPLNETVSLRQSRRGSRFCGLPSVQLFALERASTVNVRPSAAVAVTFDANGKVTSLMPFDTGLSPSMRFTIGMNGNGTGI